jgi:hypothetical protein
MVSPLCPRCTYDLSGTTATWTDRCPLEGQCAECGLEFAWGRVLALAEHPWLFEYHWRRRPLYRLVRTWFAALRPARFWREVRMTDPIRLRPLGVVVGGLFLAAMTSGYVLILVVWYDWFIYYARRPPGASRPPGARGWPDFLLHILGELARGVAFEVSGLLVALLATPLVFLLLPHTLAQAKVRPAHIVRIWFYSLLFPLAVLGAWAFGQAVLLAAGWDAVAERLNPWLLAGTISWVDHPMLASLGPNVVGVGLLLFYAGWGAYWSWCGCRFYLRLAQPGRVVAALTLIVILAAMCAQFWADVARHAV